MARPTNYSQQLMAQFTRTMKRLAPSFTVVQTSLTDGSPAAQIKSGATLIALAAITTLSYQGFNIVGDISASAGEGTPEHTFKLYCDTNASGMSSSVEALFTVLAARTGTATTELYEGTNSPAEAEFTAAQLQQTIAASAEVGAVGG